MKFFAVLCVFASAALVSAAPQRSAKDESTAKIVSQNSNLEADGSYLFNYDTENGIRAEETGTLKRASSPDKNDVIIAQGSYSYTSPEGDQISVQYVADDNGGFVASGAHLPTPPPIPAAIQKAIDYILSIPESQRQK